MVVSLRLETWVYPLRVTCLPVRCHRWHFAHTLFLLQAKRQQNITSQRQWRYLALADSRWRSQHEGTTRSGSWRQQAPWWFDVAALERQTQCHMGLSTSNRVPSPGPEWPSLQLLGRQTNTARSAGPTTCSQWLCKLLVSRVPVLRRSWRKSEGVWLRWRRTLEKPFFFSNACLSCTRFNDSACLYSR